MIGFHRPLFYKFNWLNSTPELLPLSLDPNWANVNFSYKAYAESFVKLTDESKLLVKNLKLSDQTIGQLEKITKIELQILLK